MLRGAPDVPRLKCWLVLIQYITLSEEHPVETASSLLHVTKVPFDTGRNNMLPNKEFENKPKTTGKVRNGVRKNLFRACFFNFGCVHVVASYLLAQFVVHFQPNNI